MSFQNELKFIQTLLQEELLTFFEEKRKEAEKVHPELVPLVDQIADLTLRGGKRMRPFLCWLGHEIAKKSKVTSDLISTPDVSRLLLDAMIGFELFHSFALIHDDIIDHDKVRRGGVTIQEYFEEKGKSLSARLDSAKRAGKAGKKEKRMNAIHFGTGMAILAGDLALAWVDEVMGEVARLSLRATTKQSHNSDGIATSSRRNAVTPRNDVSIWKAYQQMKEQVILGQTLDVMGQFGFAHISKDKVNELKTAWYTVIWPLTIGALLAHASQKVIFHLQRYGLLVGKAYQLRDDFMDGDITKKDFFSHIKEYKRNVEQTIDAYPADGKGKGLMSDVASFVVSRHS